MYAGSTNECTTTWVKERRLVAELKLKRYPVVKEKLNRAEEKLESKGEDVVGGRLDILRS